MSPKGLLWGLALSLPLWAALLWPAAMKAQTASCTPTPSATATPSSTPAAVAYVDGSGNIYHSHPQPDGCGGYVPAATVYPLQPAPAATLVADFSAANISLTLSNPVGPDANGQYSAAISTPTPGPTTNTLAVGANAGTGATVALVAGAGSNLTRGAIQWTAGTTPTAGAQFVVTFRGAAFSSVPYVSCFPRTAATAALGLFATSQNTSGVTISSASAPTAGATYSCEYLVVA